ncbi:MAG: hypothetical protein WC736_14785 [Gallionella sp.]|jgi:hypothetical protein
MILTAWAARHNIDPLAIAELRSLIIGEYTPSIKTDASPLSEAAVQNNARLTATRRGDRLFRNNVGVLKDERGVPVRFGLANDSTAVNKVVKSSDLIGIKRVVITPAHVGQIIGQFYAVECKPGNWKYTGTEREQAQLKFLSIVTALGGCGHFSTGEI